MGKLKRKGIFAKPGLMKNPQNEIVKEAVIAFIQHGTPLKETIYACTDPAKFLTLRTVRGGAMVDGEPIGKSVRWYYSTRKLSSIVYKTNGNTVPNSDGGVPLMDLPSELPSDLDLRRYYKEARELLELIDV